MGYSKILETIHIRHLTAFYLINQHLRREAVIDWFGGLSFYEEYHEKKYDQLTSDKEFED